MMSNWWPKRKTKYEGNKPKKGRLIASLNGWKLYIRTSHSQTGWVNLKLICLSPSKKGNYWLAFNKERFSDCHDMKILIEYNPEVLDWVRSVISQVGESLLIEKTK